MKDLRFKVEPRHLTYVLAALGLVLVAMGVAGFVGVHLPASLASNVTNGVIICALAVFMYNRKLRADEAKARVAKEKEKAAPEE